MDHRIDRKQDYTWCIEVPANFRRLGLRETGGFVLLDLVSLNLACCLHLYIIHCHGVLSIRKVCDFDGAGLRN